jgi:two-component system response regulator NreC
MAGGTLVASKAGNLYSDVKEWLEGLGFRNVTVTGVERDGLFMLIDELKPDILLIGSSYFRCCTPLTISELHRRFPKLNIAAICFSSDFPADRAMYFINNGARSYVNYYAGKREFYKGIGEIIKGNAYVSPEVQERINKRDCLPDPSGPLAGRKKEMAWFICNGYTGAEIADAMQISVRSVDSRKTEIYTALAVRNENELIREVLRNRIFTFEEMNDYPKGYELKPLPESREQRETKIIGG